MVTTTLSSGCLLRVQHLGKLFLSTIVRPVEQRWVLCDLILRGKRVHILSALSFVYQVLPIRYHFFYDLQLFLIVVEYGLFLEDLVLLELRDFSAAVLPIEFAKHALIILLLVYILPISLVYS